MTNVDHIWYSDLFLLFRVVQSTRTAKRVGCGQPFGLGSLCIYFIVFCNHTLCDACDLVKYFMGVDVLENFNLIDPSKLETWDKNL